VVADKTLAPDAQAFKALVIRSNDSMTVEGASKVAQFAHAGLPIVFSGGIPTSYLGTNPPGAVQNAQNALAKASKMPNVHVTSSGDGLAATLASIGVLPATRFNTDASGWYTLFREDKTHEIDYYYVYSDQPYLPLGEGSSDALIEFSSTGYVYELDLWSGEETPLLTYQQDAHTTTIPMTLAGNQSTILAFSKKPLTGHESVPHLDSVSDNVIGHTVQNNGQLLLKATGGSVSYTTPQGKKTMVQVPQTKAITLMNWDLTAEHWDPPKNLLDIEGGALKSNTTHKLAHLVSWQQIPGLQNVSGRGIYSASFQWRPSTKHSSFKGKAGAIIDFGPVVHTLAVSINGHALPALDVTSAKRDISQWLVDGENTVVAEVSTPLGNVLIGIWDSLETSGSGPAGAEGGPPPLVASYGLIKDVTIQPYWAVPASV
jgi:hypothetical protein